MLVINLNKQSKSFDVLAHAVLLVLVDNTYVTTTKTVGRNGVC